MAPSFLILLPGWLVDLIAETEAAIGFEIQVAVVPELQHLKVNVGASVAQILTPTIERFQAASVYHELLHVRRQLVEGVPRLDASSAIEDGVHFLSIQKQAAREDNAIEHLVTVPIELERFPERRAYWEGIVERNLGEVAEGRLPEPHSRATLIGTWLFLKLVLAGSPSEPVLLQTLQDRGLVQDAELAVGLVGQHLGDKPGLVRAWFKALGHDIGLVELEYLNPATGLSTHAAVSAL